jgi:hypothetical protein
VVVASRRAARPRSARPICWLCWRMGCGLRKLGRRGFEPLSFSFFHFLFWTDLPTAYGRPGYWAVAG